MGNGPVRYPPRVAALVGPYTSGKTTLFEAILAVTGAVTRRGTVDAGSSVGDASPEARARAMSVECNIAETEILGDPWTFIDCPGSVEFQQEALDVLSVADIAVVVCDPDPARAVMLTPVLKALDDQAVPHMVFVNKMDNASEASVAGVMEAVQAVSDRPLVLRAVPMREGGEGRITGLVDLISERAYRFRPGKPSETIRIPEEMKGREAEARQELLESLADHDDRLLEELLEDVVPPPEEIFESMARDVAEDLLVPLFFGSALEQNGVRRLLKALRHETPTVDKAAQRTGLEVEQEPVARVFKALHAAHTGKLCLARVFSGAFTDGMELPQGRIGGLFTLFGAQQTKRTRVEKGEVAAFARLDDVGTGDLLGKGRVSPLPDALPPFQALSLRARRKQDEVKLTRALAKLCEEDRSLSVEQNPETGELLLWGQGEIHLAVACERLQGRYGLEVETFPPAVPYKETIRKDVTHHARYKRQSGGHGQFGDVVLEIAPLPQGSGFNFSEKVVGGVVPRQYIPSVEAGVREALVKGPLGFPVVDLAVTLIGGQHHSVDSSDQAFRTAGALAMREALPQCQPVLLEPVLHVEVSVPNEATSKAQRALSSRRGQILGFDAKPGWSGWDVIQAYLPQSEMQGLIVELRSQTMGVGRFVWRFGHMQELTGKAAERVIE